MKTLIAHGARLEDSSDGKTALHRAAWFGEYTLVEALLQAGAKPNARTSLGATALDQARSGKHKQYQAVCQLLKDYGGRPGRKLH